MLVNGKQHRRCFSEDGTTRSSLRFGEIINGVHSLGGFRSFAIPHKMRFSRRKALTPSETFETFQIFINHSDCKVFSFSVFMIFLDVVKVEFLLRMASSSSAAHPIQSEVVQYLSKAPFLTLVAPRSIISCISRAEAITSSRTFRLCPLASSFSGSGKLIMKRAMSDELSFPFTHAARGAFFFNFLVKPSRPMLFMFSFGILSLSSSTFNSITIRKVVLSSICRVQNAFQCRSCARWGSRKCGYAPGPDGESVDRGAYFAQEIDLIIRADAIPLPARRSTELLCVFA